MTGNSTNTLDSTSIREVRELLCQSNQIYYSNINYAKVLADQAFAIAKDIEYKKGMADVLMTIGIIYDIQGDVTKSFSTYKQANKQYDEIDNELGMANCKYNISILLIQQENFDEALGYANDAYQLYRGLKIAENDYNRFNANALGTIGNILVQKGGSLDTITYKLDQARDLYAKTGSVTGICSTLNLKGDGYLKHGNFDKALIYYSKAEKLLLNQNSPWYLGYSYLGLTKTYLELNKLEQATLTAQKGIEQYRSIGSKFNLVELHKLLVLISERKGDYATALDNYRNVQSYKDSVSSEKQIKQLNQLKIEFKTEKKEAKIASLSQEISVRLLEIKQKNQAIIIGFMIALLVLSTFYFFNRQRSLKRQQSQTELEQRFLRSQLNPHFISNALLAVQNFMLKNQADRAASYLAKFSKLMREILENSRQEFILVEDEIEMLKNYMDIHKLRMNDAFDYTIKMDKSIDPESDTIPPMFVQPFIENAIEHGIVNAKNGGLIELSFIKSGDYISIEIKDNGEGLSKSEVTENHTSLSTTIIRERMELFNKSLKNKIQLLLGDYSNDQGKILGTKVELKVPFSYL